MTVQACLAYFMEGGEIIGIHHFTWHSRELTGTSSRSRELRISVVVAVPSCNAGLNALQSIVIPRCINLGICLHHIYYLSLACLLRVLFCMPI